MIRFSSRRLLGVSIAGLIVISGGSFGVISAVGSAGSRPRASFHGGRYVDPRFGWTIRVPNGMVVEHFASDQMFTTDGATITNFSPDLGASSGQTQPAMGWLRMFPQNGVALQLWFGERIPTVPPLRDTTLPLPPGSFHAIRPYVGGAEPTPLYRSFFADGFPFTAAAWFGPRASQPNRQAIWRVVRSLHFPPLREGTFWQSRYYVLSRASRYPTGSVTLIPKSALAHPGFKPPELYLIHAPRAFYVIKEIFSLDTQPFTTCKIAFDRKASQFFCPGTDLRWDRVGRPTGVHADSQDWILPLIPATVAHDGHILFSPFFGDDLGIDLKGNPWVSLMRH